MVPFRKKKKRKNGSPQLCLDPKNASNTAGLVGSGWYLLPVYLDVRLVKRLFSEQIPAGCLPSLHGGWGRRRVGRARPLGPGFRSQNPRLSLILMDWYIVSMGLVCIRISA